MSATIPAGVLDVRNPAELAHGALPNGKRLFSEKQASEMWAPVTPMPSVRFC